VSRPGDRYRCSCATPRLTARIGGRTVPVHAAFAGDPLSRLYCARCARCHGRYTGPWQPDRQDAGLPGL
jgi:hypothetical protein